MRVLVEVNLEEDRKGDISMTKERRKMKTKSGVKLHECDGKDQMTI